MSDSDDTMSSSESNLSEQESLSDNSEEMEVVGHVQPYQDEPLAHSSDDEEDNEGDQDGLSPVVLRNSFEGNTLLDEW